MSCGLFSVDTTNQCIHSVPNVLVENKIYLQKIIIPMTIKKSWSEFSSVYFSHCKEESSSDRNVSPLVKLEFSNCSRSSTRFSKSSSKTIFVQLRWHTNVIQVFGDNYSQFTIQMTTYWYAWLTYLWWFIEYIVYKGLHIGRTHTYWCCAIFFNSSSFPI